MTDIVKVIVGDNDDNDNKNKNKEFMKIWILKCCDVNISEFEKEFNEIFIPDNIEIINNNLVNYNDDFRPYRSYNQSKEDNTLFYFTFYWMNHRKYNGSNNIVSKYINFMKKYNTNFMFFCETLNNHPSNVFRTPYKKIEIEHLGGFESDPELAINLYI